MIRQPIVAGQFYPAEMTELQRQLDGFVDKGYEKVNALGVISPHAGYVFSGGVAGSVFSRINVPGTVVILAPNHTGRGPRYSVWPDGSWRTPLGDTRVDEDLADRLVSGCALLTRDYDAHLQEHSAEVILPFLQHTTPEVRIVVIVVMSSVLDELKELGRCIATAVKGGRADTLVVASSDMTHQESEVSANKKDKAAIDEVVRLDEDGLYERVRGMDISMCGVHPSVSMLVSAKERGATSACLTRYATSGAVTGDYRHVVGYAGVIVQQ